MTDVLRAIAARIEPGMRVAVDGVTASGKTLFADALAELVPGAVRVSIDDFHRPPPHEYYPDSFDFAAFREHIAGMEGTLIADGVFLHHPELVDLWDLTIFLAVDRDLAVERGIARDGSSAAPRARMRSDRPRAAGTPSRRSASARSSSSR